ncbi:hypothetical protein E0L93_10310 [Rubrobacter taiwanensis]|uniref:Uncharacterized protein n=1 Tax=Rubrobacter taiwanensis TaxID=185139 RepID=A0A4R1BG73_9ACTN|nr:hypothetical protein [Rubrobacter taiwanensis]TCJ16216.1 hypothetical protein E0L93_10310 [Rubrobacter taiwanensis]
MAAGSIEGRDGGFAGRDEGKVSAGHPVLVHHVVARHGDEGLEVLRVPMGARGEALPVFSAGWAARGYLFAEAPGGGWYARACTPDELISLLAGPGADVGWVALDPRPGRSGVEAPNVMPRENFVDYLLSSRAVALLRRSDSGIIGATLRGDDSTGRRRRASGDAQRR